MTESNIKFGFNSCGINIDVDTNYLTYETYIKKSQHLIPKIRSNEEKSSQISLIIHSGVENDLKLNSMNGFLKGNYNQNQLTMDSIMILSRLLEYQLNLADKYSVHSSAIGNSSGGFLFIGPANSGKTTLAYKIKTLTNSSIISGDRTVLFDNKIIGGTEKLMFRKGSIIYDFPELNFRNIKPTGTEWSELSTYNVDTFDFDAFNLKKIFLVKRTDSSYEEMELVGDSKFLRFYEQASYFQESFPNIILGQKKPMISFNNYSLQERRIVFSLSLLDKIPLISVSGSLDELAENIITKHM